jgi:hypothetical protein
VFTTELCLRVAGRGAEFFYGEDWSWNWFDFVVVLSDIVDTLLSTFANSGSSNSFTVVRLLRVLRVTRALRIIKLFTFFREFRMMVLSILSSAGSLVWSIVLFVIDIYLFSIYLVQAVTGHLSSDDRTNVLYDDALVKFFGTVLAAGNTLFQAVAGGISWVEIYDVLVEVGWIHGVIFIFYIFLTWFALTNIITGIFVDTAIQGAQHDRDEVIQGHILTKDSQLNQLKDIFHECDTDASGSLTMEEFEHHLEDKTVRANLAVLGLETDEAIGVFRLLDIDNSGSVTIDEFLMGCMRFKGNARSIDLATLMYENKRMYKQIKVFLSKFEEAFYQKHDDLSKQHVKHMAKVEEAIAKDSFTL